MNRRLYPCSESKGTDSDPKTPLARVVRISILSPDGESDFTSTQLKRLVKPEAQGFPQ